MPAMFLDGPEGYSGCCPRLPDCRSLKRPAKRASFIGSKYFQLCHQNIIKWFYEMSDFFGIFGCLILLISYFVFLFIE